MDKVAKGIGSNTVRIDLPRTGITALIALGILESIQEQGLVGDLLKMDHNSPEYLHTLVEALRLILCASLHEVRLIPKPRLAFAGDSPSLRYVGWFQLRLCDLDSQHYVADPDVQHVPVKELLSRVRLSPSSYRDGVHTFVGCRTISHPEQLFLTLRWLIPG